MAASRGIRQASSLPHRTSTFRGSSLSFRLVSLGSGGASFPCGLGESALGLHCGGCMDQSPCPSLLSTLIPITVQLANMNTWHLPFATWDQNYVSQWRSDPQYCFLLLKGVDKEAWMPEHVLYINSLGIVSVSPSPSAQSGLHRKSLDFSNHVNIVVAVLPF